MPTGRHTRWRQSTDRFSGLESRTRSQAGFGDTESSLARVSTERWPESRRQNKVTQLLSYLGSRNPLPVPITDGDVVWLMDNVAFRGAGGEWHAEFVAAAFEQRPSLKIVDLVGDIASKVGLSRGDWEEKTIERRIAPFVMQVLPGRQIRINFDRSTKLKLGPGGRNGISSDVKRLGRAPRRRPVAKSTADVPSGVVGMLEMKTVFAEPEGWATISGV